MVQLYLKSHKKIPVPRDNPLTSQLTGTAERSNKHLKTCANKTEINRRARSVTNRPSSQVLLSLPTTPTAQAWPALHRVANWKRWAGGSRAGWYGQNLLSPNTSFHITITIYTLIWYIFNYKPKCINYYLNHSVQLRNNVFGCLVSLLIDSGPNLDILVQSNWILHIV